MTMLASPRWAAVAAVLLIGPVLLAATPGCKKKKEPGLSPAEATRAEELQPEAAERLSQIARLRAKAKATPRTSADEPMSAKIPPGRYALLGEEYLEDPKATGSELDFGDARVWLCKSAVERVEHAREDLAHLEACASLEYAAVIRKDKYVPPEAGDHNYKAGEFQGDLLVFHLATGELRGRYTLSAQNDQQIKTKAQSEKYEVEKLAAKELEAKVKGMAADKLK